MKTMKPKIKKTSIIVLTSIGKSTPQLQYSNKGYKSNYYSQL